MEEVTSINIAGLIAVLGTLAVATVVGLLMKSRAGRIRAVGAVGGAGWTLARYPPGDGDRVLLLQISSPVCTPCRQTAALLTGLVERTPAIVHVEVDVADRPEVATALGIMRTPTVVAFDRAGTELLRISGVPRLPDLESALAPTLAAA